MSFYDDQVLSTLRSIDRTLKRIATALENKANGDANER